jgi:hypothetical protein
MTSRIAFGTARSFRSEQPKTVNGSNTKVLQQRRKRFITAATVPAIPSPESVGESICGGRSYGLVGLSSTEHYPRLTPERFRHQLNLLGPKRGRRRSGGRSWSDEILGTAVNCSPPETWAADWSSYNLNKIVAGRAGYYNERLCEDGLEGEGESGQSGYSWPSPCSLISASTFCGSCA